MEAHEAFVVGFSFSAGFFGFVLVVVLLTLGIVWWFGKR